MFDASLYEDMDLSEKEFGDLFDLEVLQQMIEAGEASPEEHAEFKSRLRRFKQAVRRRKPIPREMRAAIWEMTNGRCFYCGRWTNPYETLEIDHIRPKSRGGTDDIDNLVPSCTTCNKSKGDQLLEEWRIGKSVYSYESGLGYVFGYKVFPWSEAGSEDDLLWFETEDFRSARYEQRRAFIIQQWNEGRHDGFNGEFSSFPRYAPEVCRVQGVMYNYVWYEGQWVFESWARAQEDNKNR